MTAEEAQIVVDRKILADLAVSEPEALVALSRPPGGVA
jgi:ribosomal protein L20